MMKLNICHYCYGLEPFKRGGAPVFIEFLMNEQKSNNLLLLYPGHYSLISKKQVIKKSKLYKKNAIYKAFEIVNPKPIPICNGVVDIDSFISNYKIDMWNKFFDEHKLDVVHVHTLFGLDSTFFDACKKHNIKTIFTSHEIFGICPRTSPLFFDKCKGHPSELCGFCSKYAFSMRQNKILQSNLYNKFKQSKLIKSIRQKKMNERVVYQKEQNSLSESELLNLINRKSTEYEKLQNYYVSLMNQFDFVHFNSELSKDTFLRFIKPKSYSVIPISHSGITDNREKHTKVIVPEKISLLILGNNKGMYETIDVLDELWNAGITNFELNVHSGNNCPQKPFLHKFNEFSHADLPNICNSNDLLIYNECSFASLSFIIEESLSYGVPVLASGYVGAKDLIRRTNGGFIVEFGKNQLKETINSILQNIDILKEKTKFLKESSFDFKGSNLIDLYETIIKEKK